MTAVSIPNPDQQFDSPLYEGELHRAHEYLVHGDYAATIVFDSDHGDDTEHDVILRVEDHESHLVCLNCGDFVFYDHHCDAPAECLCHRPHPDDFDRSTCTCQHWWAGHDQWETDPNCPEHGTADEPVVPPAVARLIEVWGNHASAADEIGTHLTCIETETLCAVFTDHGADGIAERIRLSHLGDDDECDDLMAHPLPEGQPS